MMISPIHSTTKTPHSIKLPDNVNDWSIELKADIFYAQVDGWYLEIADRLINGWKNPFDGDNFIEGICPPNTLNSGATVHHIPDSAYAALRIMVNYFETIYFYKSASTTGSVKVRFIAGVCDVFPEEIQKEGSPSLGDVLYKDVRSGLYHAIALNPTKTVIRLRHIDDETIFYRDNSICFIDPHNLVRRLRNHLTQFVIQIKNTEEVELRAKFEQAFNWRVLDQKV